ncbi:hypothetical protein [Frankia sp. EUN1f]|uniref:hypothetical protein n=1 Tax=Parafrankia sp. EUN1f TaxID=102897 RepID=UPI000A045B12
MCPGNSESAGKHYSGRIPPRRQQLRGALGEAASSSKTTYLSAHYQQVITPRQQTRSRRGLAHHLMIAWHPPGPRTPNPPAQ